MLYQLGFKWLGPVYISSIGWRGWGTLGFCGNVWEVPLGLIYTIPGEVLRPSQAPPFQKAPLERVYDEHRPALLLRRKFSEDFVFLCSCCLLRCSQIKAILEGSVPSCPCWKPDMKFHRPGARLTAVERRLGLKVGQ